MGRGVSWRGRVWAVPKPCPRKGAGYEGWCPSTFYTVESTACRITADANARVAGPADIPCPGGGAAAAGRAARVRARVARLRGPPGGKHATAAAAAAAPHRPAAAVARQPPRTRRPRGIRVSFAGLACSNSCLFWMNLNHWIKMRDCTDKRV